MLVSGSALDIQKAIKGLRPTKFVRHDNIPGVTIKACSTI
jgi:hypothetical protein